MEVWRPQEAAGGRVICSNEHFLCFVPFASICPFETWILPRRHLAHYHRMNDVEVRFLALSYPLCSLNPQTCSTLSPSAFLNHNRAAMRDTTLMCVLGGQLDAYAAILHEALKRLNAELDEPNLNLVVSSAPVPDRARAAAYNYDAFYSWHTVCWTAHRSARKQRHTTPLAACQCRRSSAAHSLEAFSRNSGQRLEHAAHKRAPHDTLPSLAAAPLV